MEQFTFTPPPDEIVRSLSAARRLQAIGLPASGAFLSAAEHLIDRGIEVTQSNVADVLHDRL